MSDWRVGEYIIYRNGERYELGRIDRCRALSQSALCAFCQMKCPELGGEDE
jgi:hypothetical protein